MTDDPNAQYRPPARPPTVACDFDDSLTHWAFPECGEPRESVFEALRILQEKGWQIIIHTCRVNSHWEEPERTEKVQDMLEWLVAHNVPFDRVWGIAVSNGPPTSGPAATAHGVDWVTLCYWRYSTETGKPLADAYICDATVNPLFAPTEREPTGEEIAEWCERLLERRTGTESEAETCDTD